MIYKAKQTLAEQWRDVVNAVNSNTSAKVATVAVESSKNNTIKRKREGCFLSGPFSEVFLTTRQAQCLYLLGKGHTRKIIANQLQISLRTVETHIEVIKRKLNIRFQKELVAVIRKGDIIQNYQEIE